MPTDIRLDANSAQMLQQMIAEGIRIGIRDGFESTQPLPDAMLPSDVAALRDRFAMAAISAHDRKLVLQDPQLFARLCYELADAMLKARKPPLDFGA